MGKMPDQGTGMVADFGNAMRRKLEQKGNQIKKAD
jgi:hypothetical protein